MTALPPSLLRHPGQLASLNALAAISEEEIWLASPKSARTRRTYSRARRISCAHSASRHASGCAR